MSMIHGYNPSDDYDCVPRRVSSASSVGHTRSRGFSSSSYGAPVLATMGRELDRPFPSAEDTAKEYAKIRDQIKRKQIPYQAVVCGAVIFYNEDQLEQLREYYRNERRNKRVRQSNTMERFLKNYRIWVKRYYRRHTLPGQSEEEVCTLMNRCMQWQFYRWLFRRY